MFGFNTITLGLAASILASNPNLATGYPVIEQPMVVRAGKLVPQQTSRVLNGGFERTQDGIHPDDFTFQDGAGVRTRVVTDFARSGDASFRADARGGDMSRISTIVAVQPWKQYTISVWARTKNLTARGLQIIIKEPDGYRRYSNQWPSFSNGDNRRTYVRKVNDWTTRDSDWTEFRIPFNSQDAFEVQVLLGVYGGTAGTVWWDDLEISDTPTTNWIRRDDLDQTLKAADGTELIEGTDVSLIQDPLMGQIRYTGQFDTCHKMPPIEVLPESRLSEGDTATLSGWHAQITARGQTGASWNNRRVAQLVAAVHRRLRDEFRPDFILYNDSEIRTGGFEPTDKEYRTSGLAFAAKTRRHIRRIIRNSGDASVLVFSDMFDPEHNARDDYYQIESEMAESWRGLDPDKVIIVNWWSGDNLRGAKAANSVAHFADLGFRQIIAGYYEESVADNRQAWQRATQGYENGLVGSMFYTNRDGYQDLDEFGREWWQ